MGVAKMHSFRRMFIALFTLYFSCLASGTTFCNDCEEFIISSSGPAAQAYPDSFGTYKRDGSVFESMLPFFLNPDTGLYVTTHPWSNPMIYFAPWVVSVSPIGSYGDLSPITIKTQDDYESGLLCPWDNEGLTWEYRTGNGNMDFAPDDTITVQCIKK